MNRPNVGLQPTALALLLLTGLYLFVLPYAVKWHSGRYTDVPGGARQAGSCPVEAEYDIGIMNTITRSFAMSTPDYDDPDVEERWCSEQQNTVAEYLRSQKVKHGRIGEWPAWHIAPYVSIWAIESHARLESIGWWAICGDLPTDYISSADVKPPQHPRKAMRVIARNWIEVVEAWKEGREVENTRIGDPGSHEELKPLLEARAKLLFEFADDDSLWEEPNG